MSAAKQYGVKLYHKVEGAGAFVETARVTSLSPPQHTREGERYICADSPGGYDEYIATIASAGEVSFQYKVNRPSSGASSFKTMEDLMNNANVDWEIEFTQFGTGPNFTKVAFSGPITSNVIQEMDLRGTVMANATIQVSGPLTWSNLT
jgi:hypothetical protein